MLLTVAILALAACVLGQVPSVRDAAEMDAGDADATHRRGDPARSRTSLARADWTSYVAQFCLSDSHSSSFVCSSLTTTFTKTHVL